MKKLLLFISLLIGVASFGQTYNPSIAGTTSNKPYAPAQFSPTDSRSYFYDATNFTWRPYQNTNEVLSYLNLSKYRAGQFDIIVNTGGILSSGVITGGVNTVWYFKNGQADSNLVTKIPSANIPNTVLYGRRLTDSTFKLVRIDSTADTVLVRGTAAGGISSLSMVTPLALFNSPVNFSNTGGAWTGGLVLNSQAANTFFRGPTTGGGSQPSFGPLVITDLPTGIPNANLQNSLINLIVGGTGTSPGFSTATVSLGGTLTLNLPIASNVNTGILSAADWIRFNNSAAQLVTSVNGQQGAVVVKNADSIKHLPIDTSADRQGYVMTFDSTNHKWFLAPPAAPGGTVYNFSSGNATGLFSTTVATATTTPAQTFTLNSQTQNLVFASPNGSTGTPSFRGLVNGDFPTSGVSAGTYTSVTVNPQGIVTGGTNPGSGITSLNGLTAGTQLFAVGTSGSNFNINSSGSTHTFNLPSASAAARGALTSADWITFNAKINLTSLSALPPILYDNTTGIFSLDTSAGNAHVATQGYVNNQGFLKNVTGLVTQGTNVTITGSGTSGSPYVINASGGSGVDSAVVNGFGIAQTIVATTKYLSFDSTAGGGFHTTGYNNIHYAAFGSGGTGTVTSFSAGALSPLFTTSVATSTSTPALTFTLSNAPANSWFGNNTGSSAAPAYYTATQLTANLNLFTTSLQGLVPASGGGTTNFLRADGTWAAPPGGGTPDTVNVVNIGPTADDSIGYATGTHTLNLYRLRDTLNLTISYSPNGSLLLGSSPFLTTSPFHNQGTTTTVLHGNAAGNLSFGSVALATDVSGSLPNANLANSTISGVALGGTLFSHSAGYGITGSAYNGSAAQTWIIDTISGTGVASKAYVLNHSGGGGGSQSWQSTLSVNQVATTPPIMDSAYSNNQEVHTSITTGDSAYATPRLTVAFGNSLTSGTGAIGNYWNGFVWQFANMTNTLVINNGVAGTSLHGSVPTLALKIPTYNPSKYQFITLEFGINDQGTGTTTSQFTADVIAFVDSCNNHGWPSPRVIVISVPFEGAANNILRFPYVAAAQSGAATAGATFANVYTYMQNNGGYNLITSDSVHPNPTGHHVMAQGVFLAVAQSLKPTGYQQIYGSLSVGGPFNGIGPFSVFGGDANINGLTVGLGGGQLANTVFGFKALADSANTGTSNTAIGLQSMFANTTGSGNTGVGRLSLFFNTIGTDLTAVGNAALQGNTSGVNNTGLGWGALSANSTGSDNTAVGMSALLNATGSFNTAIGFNAALATNTGSQITAGGEGALAANTTGSSNSAWGCVALTASVAVNHQSALGAAALQSVVDGGDNTGVGYASGFNIIHGLKNTFLGSGAGNTDGTTVTTDVTGSVAIGYDAQIQQNNSMALGGVGANALRVAIGGVAPSSYLHLPQGKSTAGFSSLKIVITNLITTSISTSGGSVTISFSARLFAPFAVGDSITVAGVTPTGYNGNFIVTACSTTSVTYINATTGAQSVAGTIILAHPLLTTTEPGAIEVFRDTIYFTGISGTRYPLNFQGSGTTTLQQVLTAGKTFNTALLSNGSVTTDSLLSISTSGGVATVNKIVQTVVSSGTYTGTITTISNCTSPTSGVGHYLRVGNQVTVDIPVVVSLTTTLTATEFYVSLPVSSAISSGADLTGTGTIVSPTTLGLGITGNSANHVADVTFTCSGTGSNNVYLHFTYTID